MQASCVQYLGNMTFSCLWEEQQLSTVDTRQADAHSILLSPLHDTQNPINHVVVKLYASIANGTNKRYKTTLAEASNAASHCRGTTALHSKIKSYSFAACRRVLKCSCSNVVECPPVFLLGLCFLKATTCWSYYTRDVTQRGSFGVLLSPHH